MELREEVRRKYAEAATSGSCCGGIDVILSAKRVRPSGRAYGLDMTDEMLALAQRNAADAGVSNAIFLKGVIEDVSAACSGPAAASEPPTSSRRTGCLRPSGRSAGPTSLYRGRALEA